MIDKNGPPKTGGTGIKQLRENIAESKLSYEIMDDAAQVRIMKNHERCAHIITHIIFIIFWHQVFLKSKIMDNIHKYYYLIAFTAFMRYSLVIFTCYQDDQDDC